MTERVKYLFKVTEWDDGTPWITLEPLNSNLKVLGKGFIGFDLRKNCGLKEAKKLATILNNNIESVSFTE